MVYNKAMKTTLDMPDPLFRQMKIAAATRGVTIKDLVVSALEKELNVNTHFAPTASIKSPLQEAEREALWASFAQLNKLAPSANAPINSALDEFLLDKDARGF